jgi:hypothetical protein
MRHYQIKLIFTDIDENLNTRGIVSMMFDVEACDTWTASHLGERLRRSFLADYMEVILKGKE